MQNVYNLKQLRELVELYNSYEIKIKEYIKLSKVAIKDQKITNKSLKSSATKLEYQTGKLTIKELKRKRKHAKQLNKKIKKMKHALTLTIKNFQNKHFKNVWDVNLNLEIKDLVMEINKKRGITKEEYLPHIEGEKEQQKIIKQDDINNKDKYSYDSLMNGAFDLEESIDETQKNT